MAEKQVPFLPIQANLVPFSDFWSLFFKCNYKKYFLSINFHFSPVRYMFLLSLHNIQCIYFKHRQFGVLTIDQYSMGEPIAGGVCPQREPFHTYYHGISGRLSYLGSVSHLQLDIKINFKCMITSFLGSGFHKLLSHTFSLNRVFSNGRFKMMYVIIREQGAAFRRVVSRQMRHCRVVALSPCGVAPQCWVYSLLVIITDLPHCPKILKFENLLKLS